MIDHELIKKYNVPGPRYTSYPTVPYWDNNPNQADWEHLILKSYQHYKSEGLSLYIHLPFCERLCTYCGCNTRITKNHKVENPYIESLLAEWNLYLNTFGEKPLIKEIHLGGGTPTFFSPENLVQLIGTILSTSRLRPDVEMSFEAHPGNTSFDHLNKLHKLGFNRLSLGIQDFNEEVQKVINRVQTYEQVEMITYLARMIGYESINYDLIYGLPLQNRDTIYETIYKTKLLNPDRIAFYSFAYVPWMKPAQKVLETYLPDTATKQQIYEEGKQLLINEGYQEIGMDHFSRRKDSLFKAFKTGNLHRNFMGYTSQKNHLLVGLGVSSISDSWTGFIQNEKKLEDYQDAVKQGRFPFFRGHKLSENDLIIRRHILDVMCNFFTYWSRGPDVINEDTIDRLEEFEKDALITLGSNYLRVLQKGKPFVRNICMALDERLWKSKPKTQLFSNTV